MPVQYGGHHAAPGGLSGHAQVHAHHVAHGVGLLLNAVRAALGSGEYGQQPAKMPVGGVVQPAQAPGLAGDEQHEFVHRAHLAELLHDLCGGALAADAHAGDHPLQVQHPVVVHAVAQPVEPGQLHRVAVVQPALAHGGDEVLGAFQIHVQREADADQLLAAGGGRLALEPIVDLPAQAVAGGLALKAL